VFRDIRQGGVLSPLLFNIYVDDLIYELEASNADCCVCGIFFWLCYVLRWYSAAICSCFWSSVHVKHLL